MQKGIVAFVITIIVLIPFVVTIAEVGQTKDYLAKSSYRFIPPEKLQETYSSAEKFDKTINFFAKILIVLAAIFVLLLSVVEYIKFHKLYKEEMGG